MGKDPCITGPGYRRGEREDKSGERKGKKRAKRHFPAHDAALAAQVINEMILTNQILGRLLFLSEWAGLFKFDLDDLLVNFLPDPVTSA